MKVFMTGATGLIGRSLRHALTDRGDEVIALTRAPRPPAKATQWIVASPTAVGEWAEALDGCDAIVNLAGEPIAQRWSRKAMERIVQSRVGVTTALFHALDRAQNRARVMVSASAIGFYGTSNDVTFDEESPPGDGFLPRVCQEWEAAAERSEAFARVVRARFGLVLSREGGVLPKLSAPYRMMMGGPLGTGQQWVSWIHLDDAVRLLLFALERESLHGALNVTAPAPVRNRELSAALARSLHAPNLMGAAKLWLRLGLGKMAEETILEGQRVLPNLALTEGFEFSRPTLEDALRELFGR